MKLLYDMIFIYCNWVATRWQWSVDLKKRKKKWTAQKEKQYTKQYKHNTKTQCTKYKTKNKKKN